MLINREALERAETGFQVFFIEGLGTVPGTWRSWAHRINSTDLKEEIILPEGMGEMYSRSGSPPARVVVVRSATIENDDKINKFYVPIPQIKADKMDLWNRQAQLMGAAAASYPNGLVSELLKDGFTELGPDGVAFFSASHPIDGGVQSNIVSGALSSTTFETALALLQSQTDFYGKPLELQNMGLKPTLIVGPSNRAEAKRIVSVPATTGGAGNANYDEANVQVDQRLIGAYAGYWFLGYADGPVMPFVVTVMSEPELHMVTEPKDPEVRDDNVAPVWCEGSFGAGYGYCQLIVGSTG